MDRIGLDLIGQRFDQLLVVNAVGKQGRHYMIECLCDCGKTTIIRKNRLKEQTKIGCGCLRGKATRHCESNTKLYRVWDSMVRRCHSATHKAYGRYGARGIRVCDDWRDYVNFRNWAKTSGYMEGLTIERINNNLGYNSNNCCWATRKQQQNNRSACVYVTYRGETKTITEWAEALDVSIAKVYRMLKSNDQAKRTDYSTAHQARLQSRPSAVDAQ
jgi:hypothetical protein